MVDIMMMILMLQHNVVHVVVELLVDQVGNISLGILNLPHG
jgi:hypothetical protein